MNNLLFRLGAISAASSIGIQAIGGHKPWEIDRKLIFNKAFDLHITSAIGMMICSYRAISLYSAIPGFLLFGGTILFSGCAYYRCFYNDRSYNYFMPPGGMSIMLGWLLMALI